MGDKSHVQAFSRAYFSVARCLRLDRGTRRRAEGPGIARRYFIIAYKAFADRDVFYDEQHDRNRILLWESVFSIDANLLTWDRKYYLSDIRESDLYLPSPHRGLKRWRRPGL